MALLYDSVGPANIPASAMLVAGYDNGAYGPSDPAGWTAKGWARFTSLVYGVHITISPSLLTSQVIDCETGDATPAQAAQWAKAKVAAKSRPTIYCNEYTWPKVKAALASAGVSLSEVDFWIADYSVGPNIPAGAVAIQYKSANGVDTSYTNGVWPMNTPVVAPTAPNSSGLEKPVAGKYGTLAAPVVAVVPGPGGYYLFAADGGVFAYDVPFYGSLPSLGVKPAFPVVDGALTPTGKGYVLLGTDGGVFCFGDAAFEGSEGGKPLNAPAVSIAITPSGAGYWIVAADGGVFAFGDAPFLGTPA